MVLLTLPLLMANNCDVPLEVGLGGCEDVEVGEVSLALYYEGPHELSSCELSGTGEGGGSIDGDFMGWTFTASATGEVTLTADCVATNGMLDSSSCSLTVWDCPQIEGVWDLSVTDIDSTCGPDEPDWSSVVTVQQEGCGDEVLSVTNIKDTEQITPGGSTADGVVTIGPDRFTEAGGETELTFFLERAEDGSLVGDEEWTWFNAGGQPECQQGTAAVTMTPR